MAVRYGPPLRLTAHPQDCDEACRSAREVVTEPGTKTMAVDPEDTVQALVARIDNLEMRAAYQDEIIEDLNKVIVEQWSKLDHVLRRMEGLEERLRDVQDSAGADAQDEPPPPHY